MIHNQKSHPLCISSKREERGGMYILVPFLLYPRMWKHVLLSGVVVVVRHRHSSYGKARNRLLLLDQALSWISRSWKTPQPSFCGCVDYYNILELTAQLPLQSIVTIEVLFRLLTMMSSMSVPNILRLTTTLFIISILCHPIVAISFFPKLACLHIH